MKVLVSGGAGFIGSHLCARLLADGHEVLCVDNLLTGSERNIAALRADPRFMFLCHDVTEPLDPAAVIASAGALAAIEAIFHLASPASPVGYWTYPFETIRVNTVGTTRLLDLARRTGARFLMASTSEAYGNPLAHPQREDYFGNVNPVGIRACYDESKRLGETITMEYFRQYGTDARIVRIFNTYGPNLQLDDGRMIPAFIGQALRGAPLTVHGDGQQTRSICYVDDLVDGLVRALFMPDTTAQVYNLGNPTEQTVLAWARLILTLCRSSSPIRFEPKRQDDPERRQPDITRARQMLGWEPRVDPETGLARTIAWFRTELERHTSCLPINTR